MVSVLRPIRAFGRLTLSVLFTVAWSGASLAQGQPAMPEPVRMSLAEVVDYAREHAPERAVLDQELGRVAARRQAADVLLTDNPELALAIGPRFGGAAGTDFDFIVGLEQRLGISGERRQRKVAVERYERRLQSERSAYFWDLEQDIELRYRESVHKEALLAIEDRAVGFASELVRLTERRVAAGEAGAIDLHVAKADAVHAEQGRIRARSAAWDARLELAHAAGLPLHAPPLPLEGFATPEPVKPLDELLARAEDSHPELAVQDALVAEEDAEVLVQDRHARIKPTVGAQVAREGAAGSPANYIVLGTLGVPLPFFQRGQGVRAEQRVDQQVAVAERQRQKQLLRARVVRAYAELASAAQQVRLFEEGLVPELARGFELIERAYRAGELDVLRVALLRDRLLVAERDALAARAEYERRLVALEAAVGADPSASAKAGGEP